MKPSKKTRWSVREITMIAMLIALCVVGRTQFMSIMNVQPVTSILIIITIYMGFISGMTVAILSILVTNMYMGMGIWTIAQIVSFAVLICFAALLAKISIFQKNILLQALFALFSGFFYGFVISLVQAPFMGITAFWPYYFAGISADALHGFGNLGFYVILAPLLKILFNRFNVVKE